MTEDISTQNSATVESAIDIDTIPCRLSNLGSMAISLFMTKSSRKVVESDGIA